MKCRKTHYLATTVYTAITTDPPTKIQLPDGCYGIAFVFRSKKAAMAFCGEGAELMPVRLSATLKEKK